ncbi:hypothetical protein [Methylobacterium sp. Leaf91]|uniref:hypothetical protein n=1 Tax=Methylobacterium sp. Leaf91 TaxID=1736247 RepID=UPI0012E89C1B|nr:hypothetical protein [Methylobacterium sp. Leaf91]
MFSPDQQFVYDIDDLKAIQQNPTVRNLLAASAILRRLLIDATPLMHRVARPRGTKVRFKILKFDANEEFPGGVGKPIMHYSSPSGLLNENNSHMVVLDQFLAYAILAFRDKSASVKDLILYAAHNAGGVHYDPPGVGHKYSFLSENGERFFMYDQPISISPLRDVIEAVLVATENLYQSVRV